MYKFNPDNKDNLTMGEIFDIALKIKTKENASEYIHSYASWIKEKENVNLQEALRIAKSNLGYFAGYYSNKVRAQIETLFDCEHPIFGSIEEYGIPTNEEAYMLGVTGGTRIKK